jgi:hypothetical protein
MPGCGKRTGFNDSCQRRASAPIAEFSKWATSPTVPEI